MRYLCHVAAAFAAACLCCAYWLPGALRWTVAVGCAVLGMMFLLICRRYRKPMLLRLTLWMLSAAVGVGAYAMYWNTRVAPARALDGITVTAAAELRSAPAASTYGAAVLAWLDVDGERYSLRLYLDEVGDLQPGDRLHGSFRLQLPKEERQEDAEPGYLRASGVYLTASPVGDLTLQRPVRMPLRYAPALVRMQIAETCRALFSEETSPWFVALLTNQSGQMTYADKNALKLAGLYHCICTSGMHIHVLVGLISLLCLQHRRLATALGLPVCVFFWAVAGGTPSVTRAVVMQTILLLAPLLRQEQDTLTALAAALLVILLRQPDSIAHMGLQLSFLSVLGITLIAEPLYQCMQQHTAAQWMAQYLPLRGHNRESHWLLNGVLSALATSLGALLLTTPLLAWEYGLISLISPLAGLLCLDAVTLCFAIGLPVTLLGLVLPGMAQVLALPLEWLMRYCIVLVRGMARLPGAVLYLSSPLWIVWLVLAYGFFLLLWLAKLRKRVPLLCLTVSFAVTLLLHTIHVRSPAEGFRLTVLDVGQGQCLVLRSGDQTCVIDCGGSWAEDAGETCARYLLGQGVCSIDLLVLTHYHADHAGGVPQLLARVAATQVLLPDIPDETGSRAAVLDAAQNAAVTWVTSDVQLSLGAGTLQLYAPRSLEGDNESCLSVLASFEEEDILVTGDMGTETEFLLCKSAQLPDVEVFVAAHHGARDANGAYLLGRILPELVLISAGADNYYGHPHAETLERFAAIGSLVLRTDELGNLTIER